MKWSQSQSEFDEVDVADVTENEPIARVAVIGLEDRAVLGELSMPTTSFPDRSSSWTTSRR